MNDMTKLRRQLLDQGFQLKPTSGSHYKIYDPAGKLIQVMARSQRKNRGLLNLVSALRKAGAKL